MSRLVKVLLYIGLFLFSFLFFLYWTLPMETLKNRIVQTVEGSLGPEFQLKIGKLSTYRITGAKLKEVVLTQEIDGKEQPVMRADNVVARVGLFSLLFGRPKVRFEAKAEGVRLRGDITRRNEDLSVSAEFWNLDLGKIAYVQLRSGLKLASSIDGEFNFYYNAKQPLRSEGDFEIIFDKLNIQQGTLSLGEMGSFPLPDLALAASDSAMKADIEKGAIQFEKFRLKAQDFYFDMNGKIFLAPNLERFRVNLNGAFEFSPKLWAILDPLLPEPWLENLKKQKGTGEHYPLSISGQLSSPQIYSGTFKIFPFQPF